MSEQQQPSTEELPTEDETTTEPAGEETIAEAAADAVVDDEATEDDPADGLPPTAAGLAATADAVAQPEDQGLSESEIAAREEAKQREEDAAAEKAEAEDRLQRRIASLQTPTVGRIVHYFAGAGQPERAALITAVHSKACVDLRVFNGGAPDYDDQISSVENYLCNEGNGPFWVWPPIVGHDLPADEVKVDEEG